MKVKIFESRNGNILPLELEINAWLSQELPTITDMKQSESHAPMGGGGDQHTLTITFLFIPKGR